MNTNGRGHAKPKLSFICCQKSPAQGIGYMFLFVVHFFMTCITDYFQWYWLHFKVKTLKTSHPYVIEHEEI